MQPANSSIIPPPQQQQQQQQYQQQPWMLPHQQYPSQQPPPQSLNPNPAANYYYQQPQQQAVADDGIRTLWIGDLQYWMDEQYLISCFSTTGELVTAKVIRNKVSTQSEGYGFIEFVSHAAAERILQTYNGTAMLNVDQPFRLNWASSGSGDKREDGPEYTIFVGDLAPDVTDSMLQETFRGRYNSVKGAKVVTDKITGRTKGYGFVRFGDESDQVRAMSEMNGQFCSSRPMRIGPAANKQKIGVQTNAASYQISQGAPSEDDPSNTTVFVGNLDPNVGEDHLRQVFGHYGQLTHVKIPTGKRCGFVQFSDRISAEEAIRRLTGTQLGGQTIRLSWGRSPSNKQVESNPSYGGAYYGYTPGYESYGYAPPPQDPNMYYAGYPGYGSYAQPPPQQQ